MNDLCFYVLFFVFISRREFLTWSLCVCRGAKGVTKCWHAGELSAYTSYVDKDIGVYSR